MLTSFLPRAFCVLFILQVPIWLISDALSPFCSQPIYESSAGRVTTELTDGKKISAKECAELSTKYHLSWMRVADNDRRVLVNTRPASLPDIQVSQQASSRVLDLRGSRFVELVLPITGGQVAIGYSCPSLVDSLLNDHAFPGQIPAGTIFIATLLNLIAIGAAYTFLVYKPLVRLNAKLKSGQDVPDSFPVFVSSEISENLQFVKERLSNIRQEHDRAVSAARTDLSGAFAKETEDRFIGQLSKDIVSMQRTDDVCAKIVHNLKDEFTDIVKAAFGLDADSLPGLRLMEQVGFSEEQAKIFAKMNEGTLAASLRKFTTVSNVETDKIEDDKLRQIAKELGSSKCFIAPLSFHGQVLAYFCVLVESKDVQAIKKIERILKRLASELSPLWHLVSRYENAFWLSRHDQLTYVRNRLSLEEKFVELKKYAPTAGQTDTVFMIFEGDSFRVMLNSFGPRTIDKLIQELAEALVHAFDQSQRFKRSKMTAADHIYRVGGCRFLVSMDGVPIKKALEIAEQICNSIADKKNWSGALPSWSVSCGIAPLNITEELSPQDCLEEALITLEYIRSRKATGMVLSSKEVAEEFMNKALSRNQGGSLRLFDPAGLLQTVAQSGKTGILTIESSNGRVFWAYLEGGIPSKARLSNLYGDAAVLEFLASFIDGSMRLQDLSTVDNQTAEDMRNLGVAYNIQTPLMQLFDIARTSRENSTDAKLLLKNPELIVHPLVERSTSLIEKLYSRTGKPTSRMQVEVTNKVWDLCSGRLSLEELVAKLSDCPETLVWSGAGFLLQNKLIKFSRLRVSSHSDTPAEKDSSKSSKTSSPNVTTTIMNFVSGPIPCPSCRTVDPLSQKFCIHCGAEMIHPVPRE